MSTNPLTRRTALTLAGTGAALVSLAACSGDPAAGPQEPSAQDRTPTPDETPGSADVTDAGAGDEPAPLTSTSDIPVNGAKVFADHALVVTQPKAGQFHGFSSTCTHMGCTVGAGEKLVCPCHGSTYSITDGSVLAGPAPAPLPTRTIQVKDGAIYLPS